MGGCIQAARKGPGLRAGTGRRKHRCCIARVYQGKEEVREGKLGAELGPIGMTVGASETAAFEVSDAELREKVKEEKKAMKSLNTMTTAEWRAQYERDGAVDLWVEEEFNAGSRIMGGGAVHRGDMYGQLTGEGPSTGLKPLHHVTVNDHRHSQVVEVDIPEDRYILWEAEDEGLKLPYACRMGCCTACAVRVDEGTVWQPEALGISKGLKEKGYALMCVGYPESDCVLTTVEEDELYIEQFGKPFNELGAYDKNSIFVERDDFALELAEMDE